MKKTLIFSLMTFLILLVSCGKEKSTDQINESSVSESEGSTVPLELEKAQLTFGFIKLTDMAPLAIATDCQSQGIGKKLIQEGFLT